LHGTKVWISGLDLWNSILVVGARGAASCWNGGARVSSFTALRCWICGGVGGGGASLALEAAGKAFIGEGEAYGIDVIPVRVFC